MAIPIPGLIKNNGFNYNVSITYVSWRLTEAGVRIKSFSSGSSRPIGKLCVCLRVCVLQLR